MASEGSADVDLSGLSHKHGRNYVYRQTGYESLYDGNWEYYESDGLVYIEDGTMERTLTITRFDDTSSIEYMLESEGDWGEFWHVNYNYPADCTYFEDVEGGTVTLSGNTATWVSDYGDYKEIYTLQETFEFDN